MNNDEKIKYVTNKVVKEILSEMDLDSVGINSVHGLARDSYIDSNIPDDKENPINSKDTTPLNDDDKIIDSENNNENVNVSDSNAADIININLSRKKEWQKQSKFIEAMGLFLNGDINIHDTVTSIILNLDGDKDLLDGYIKKMNDFANDINKYWDKLDVSQYQKME